jgi:hypothetical protein
MKKYITSYFINYLSYVKVSEEGVAQLDLPSSNIIGLEVFTVVTEECHLLGCCAMCVHFKPTLFLLP